MRSVGLAVAAVVIACSNPKPVVVANRADPSRMELDVYSTLLRSWPVSSPSQEALFLLDTNVIVHLNPTERIKAPDGIPSVDAESWMRDTGSVAGSTRASFQRRNLDTGSVSLPPEFASEIPRLSGVDARSFRVAQRCPAQVTEACATIGFSRVGFRDDGRQAVVYMEYNCGALCADADYFVLERDGADSWHITKTIGVWVS